MTIAGLLLLEDVLEKLETKHSISPEEVVQVFCRKPHYRFY